MIVDLLILFAASILFLFSRLFALITWVIPQSWTYSISYFFGFLAPLQFVMPLQTIMSDVGYLLQFFAFYYTVRLILWAWSYVPVFGREVQMPGHGPVDNSDSRIVDLKGYNSSRNVLDLRKIPAGTKRINRKSF